MRHPLIAATLTLAALPFAFAPEASFAQGKSQQGQAQQGPSQQGGVPLPAGGFKPPPAPPVKPYQAVSLTLPKEYNDQGFVAFRKQLGDIAEHKDKAALGKVVVSQGFFWMQEKDVADKKKSSLANLVNALDLDAKDGSGWQFLSGYANEPTGEPLPDKPNVICAPAEPVIDPKAFEDLVNSTKTEPPEWGYPIKDGVEVRSAGKPDAPVVEKLGITLVRVLTDNTPPDDPNQQAFLHIATPSGNAGYVPLDAMSSLGTDQLCYIKEGGAWKITGYYGGAAQ
jgi:hypothetical protein